MFESIVTIKIMIMIIFKRIISLSKEEDGGKRGEQKNTADHKNVCLTIMHGIFEFAMMTLWYLFALAL